MIDRVNALQEKHHKEAKARHREVNIDKVTKTELKRKRENNTETLGDRGQTQDNTQKGTPQDRKSSLGIAKVTEQQPLLVWEEYRL